MPRCLRLLVLLPLALLAGCGPDRNAFPPACPLARPLPQAQRLRRFLPGRHDASGLLLQGDILSVSGKCRRAGPGTVAARLRITMRLSRGPAAPAGGVPVPYFLAVSRDGQVLSRATYQTAVHFPAGQDQITVTTTPFDVRLPVAGHGAGASYTIWVGFQLTKGEFAAEGGR